MRMASRWMRLAGACAIALAFGPIAPMTGGAEPAAPARMVEETLGADVAPSLEVRATAPASAVGQPEMSQTITDTTGDTYPGADSRADIQSAMLLVGPSGMLTGALTVVTYSDPTTWTIGASFAAWGIDTDNDATSEYLLGFVRGAGGVGAALFLPNGSTVVCNGTAIAVPSERMYIATVPIGCIGNVPSVRWYGHMQITTGTTVWDEVPNGTVWAGPVLNDGYVPPLGAKLAAGSVYRLKVTGRGGVPASSVSAVVLNVTVVDPDALGYLTVFSCGVPPLASNLNYVAHQTVPNAVIAPVSSDGYVCFFTLASTHVVADVSGWFPIAESGYHALTPARVFDTRISTPADAMQPAAGRVADAVVGAGQVVTVQMTGRNGVPASGVSAVSLNVTVTEAQGTGYITVYPCGNRPLASNLNYVAGQTVPNAVIAPVSADGKVCFYSLQPTHLLADVNGWFPGGANGIQALTPTRVFDTRDSGTKLGAGTSMTVKMTGVNGVPANGVVAVSLNVTVTEPEAGGYITVYPCGTMPLASNLNFVAGQTVPNAVIAPVSADGNVCFYSLAKTHLLADVNGYFLASGLGFQPVTPARLLDTRG